MVSNKIRRIRAAADVPFAQLAKTTVDDKYITDRVLGVGHEFDLGQLALLVGAAGSGKSVLVSRIAAELALGRPLLGRIPVFRPFRVAVLSLEYSAADVERNRLGIAKHGGFSQTELAQLDKRLFYLCRRADMNTPERFVEVLTEVVEETSADIVIIDNLLKATGGQATGGMAKAYAFTSAIEAFLLSTRTSAIIVHHPPKMNADDIAQLGFGSSGIGNAARLIIGLVGNRVMFGKQFVGTSIALKRSRDTSAPYWLNPQDETGGKYYSESLEVAFSRPLTTTEVMSVLADSGIDGSVTTAFNTMTATTNPQRLLLYIKSAGKWLGVKAARLRLGECVADVEQLKALAEMEADSPTEADDGQYADAIAKLRKEGRELAKALKAADPFPEAEE